MIRIDPKVLSSLDSIKWLQACGLDSPLSDEQYLRQVSSWLEVDLTYDEYWESIKEQQQNAITITLATHYKDKFNQWNNLFEIVREEVAERISSTLRALIEELELNPFYSNAICRDIQLYVMEVTYAQDGYKVPLFFRNLFMIYDKGHFPCGWGGGGFPAGYLFYY